MNVDTTKPVCIDASVFVSMFTKEEQSHASLLCWKFLKENAFKIICPNIVLVEISASLNRLFISGNTEIILDYIENIQSYEHLSLVEIDHFINHVAVDISLKTKNRGMDTLYLAICKQYGCNLISLDKKQLDSRDINLVTYTPEGFKKSYTK